MMCHWFSRAAYITGTYENQEVYVLWEAL